MIKLFDCIDQFYPRVMVSGDDRKIIECQLFALLREIDKCTPIHVLSRLALLKD